MKDRFSSHAKSYAAFRPTYPRDLYEFIFSQVKRFDAAWDAGTGNGQVARDLAGVFKKVFASDISAKQLEQAAPAPNIFYSIAGETTGFREKSMDLITVGQALHWFNRDLFYQEVRRVAADGGVISIWGYGLLQIEGIDNILRDFYVATVGPYWDPERKLIDEQYKTIAFPFDEIAAPAFSFSFTWTLADLEGYLNTWSAVQKYIAANGINPVDDLIANLSPLWRAERQVIRFPLFMRIGRV